VTVRPRNTTNGEIRDHNLRSIQAIPTNQPHSYAIWLPLDGCVNAFEKAAHVLDPMPEEPALSSRRVHLMLRAAALLHLLRGYIASAHPVTQMHWIPATWPPDSYHDRISTS